MGETPKSDGRSATSCLLIVAFIAAIWMPMADMLFGLAPRPALAENRQMALFPKFGRRAADVWLFAHKLKLYLRDNFGFRPALIQGYQLLKGRLLGVSSSPNVLFGKEGWLIYADENAIESYRCASPYTADQLDQMQRILEGERDWLARRGIPYLVVIVPNTHTLYPEYLPDWVTRFRSESRLDQLRARMDAHSTLRILDLRRALLDAKRHMRVSFRTDTHWNEYGAFIGYQEIMKRLAVWFPALQPEKLDDFIVATRIRPGGDMAQMIGAQDAHPEESIELTPLAPRQATVRQTQREGRVGNQRIPTIVVSELHRPDLPRLVMFRDSAANYLLPYLAEHFSRITCVSNLTEKMRFDRRIVEEEKPDVVIRELTERFLMYEPVQFTDRHEASEPDRQDQEINGAE